MRLLKWLRGKYTCRVCGKVVYLMIFGFGECICSDCYSGEQPFIFPDQSYYLNRLLSKVRRLGS